MRSLWAAVAFTLIAGAASGQGIQPLTQERYAQAIADGRAGRNLHFTYEGILLERIELLMPKGTKPGTLSQAVLDSVHDLLLELERAPYRCTIDTPYSRAAAAANEATRRFEGLNPVSLDVYNSAAVELHVEAGGSFDAAGTIDGMVLRRGREIIRPLVSDVKPTTIENKAGATRASSAGWFRFPIESFDPSKGPLTIVFIGQVSNLEFTVSRAELADLR